MRSLTNGARPPQLVAVPASSQPLAGTGELVQLALRRDRVMVPVWLAAYFLLAYVSAAAVVGLYSTEAARAVFAAGIGSNPALTAVYGPPFDLTTIGAISTLKIGTLGAVFVAVMSVLLVVRHSRAEEEAGRLELLGAAVLGRYAPLTAALLVAAGADVAMAPAVGLGLIAGGVPASASLLFGLTLSAAGLCFTGVAALTAQLTPNARTATSTALAVLGAAFLARAVGDTTGPGWLSWLSPIGWSQRIRPWGDATRVWPLALSVGFAALLAATSCLLVARRDLGAGLFAARPGPARAGPGLRGALGLAWYQQRGALAGWAVGFAVLGAVVGSVASQVTALVGGNNQVGQIFTQLSGQHDLVDATLGAYFALAGFAASAYAVAATLRLRTEESAGRAEPLLTTGLSRSRWVAGHLGIAALGAAALLLIAGVTAGLTHGLSTGDLAIQLPRVLGAALVQIPAALVLASITVALFGWAPRIATAAWGVLAAFLLLGQLGPLLQLPQWAMDLSPFTHLPKLPHAAFTATPILWLLTVAAAFITAGPLGFRRRDLG